MTEQHTAEHWLGRSVKRKEDDRFLQGRGNYVDDINLPGMLHMSILRSPVAHARINSIDTSAAEALPGVVAVVTGELLAQHNLAWMPTLSGDTQAVLATDKVRMQGQEVACVIAEDPYVAHDALELIEVDYDPLPVVVTPQQSLEPGAPVIRDDKEDKHDNRIYHWEAGDPEATERAFAEADRVVSLDTFYPRCHPAPMETCGAIADYDAATYWRGVHVPVLILYGEKDQRVPVNESAKNIEAALWAAGNSRFTIRIFPDANHTLRVPSTGSGFAWPTPAPTPGWPWWAAIAFALACTTASGPCARRTPADGYRPRSQSQPHGQGRRRAGPS